MFLNHAVILKERFICYAWELDKFASHVKGTSFDGGVCVCVCVSVYVSVIPHIS